MNRRSFLKMLGAVALAPVLPRPQPPTFALKEYYGLVNITWKMLRDVHYQTMYVTSLRVVDRYNELLLALGERADRNPARGVRRAQPR